MKTRKHFFSLFAALTVCAGAMLLTACSDDITNDGSVTPPGVIDPSVDQLTVTVTADVPTAVLSTFDDNSLGAALVRRLSNTTSEIMPETKMVLIKGEDGADRPLNDWLAAAKIYLKGGYIAVEKPVNAHLVKVMEEVADQMDAAWDAHLLENGVSIVRQARGNAAVRSDAAARFKTRIANIATRAGESADDNEPVAELVIFARNGYYHHATYQGKQYTSETRKSDGTVTTNTIEHNPDYCAYSSGLMADGAAQWLNNRGGAQQASRASTRTDGEQAINDVMDADDEWTYNGPLNAVDIEDSVHPVWDPCFVSKPNAQQEIMRIWASHNMDTNKDYYLVQHSSTSAVGGKKDGDDRLDPTKTLYRGPYGENQWEERHYEGGEKDHEEIDDRYYYGDWYDNSEFSFNVTGAGTVTVEGAVPSTDRNEISTTVTVGEFNGQTTTIGGTGSASSTGGGVTGAMNRGYVSGTFYSLSSTTTVEELACEKNTDGTKVSWKYHESKDMSAGDKKEHPLIGDGLINDVDVSNQVCWSVSDPSGQYMLEMSHQVKMGNICYENAYIKYNLEDPIDEKSITLSNAIPDGQVNMKYLLPVPNRSTQKWNMDVTFPEIDQDGYSEVKTKLTEALQNQFPSVYQPEIVLADQSDASENTIREIVADSNTLLMDDNSLQTLRDYAKTYKISEFTIKWYSSGTDHNTYQFTVKAEGDPEGVDMTIDPVDLSELTADYVAQDGDVLTGTLAGNYMISVANGAVVTLNGVTINGTNDDAYDWAGITCQDATIVLADGSKNVVKGFRSANAGIYVTQGGTLVIQGNTGSLDASSNGEGCGIGGSNATSCGNIEIQGGVITATGGDYSAGIGAGKDLSCGDIVISGGTVTATGGKYGAGIGSGNGETGALSHCGNITISGGTVTATAGTDATAIGAGEFSEAGDITIAKTVTSVTVTGAIGAGEYGKCGTVTIEDGANVIKK